MCLLNSSCVKKVMVMTTLKRRVVFWIQLFVNIAFELKLVSEGNFLWPILIVALPVWTYYFEFKLNLVYLSKVGKIFYVIAWLLQLGINFTEILEAFSYLANYLPVYGWGIIVGIMMFLAAFFLTLMLTMKFENRGGQYGEVWIFAFF